MASRPVVRIFLRVIENAEDLDGPIVAPSVDSGACRGCMGMEATGMVTLLSRWQYPQSLGHIGRRARLQCNPVTKQPPRRPDRCLK